MCQSYCTVVLIVKPPHGCVSLFFINCTVYSDIGLAKPGVKRFDAILGAMSMSTVNHKIILIWYEPILEEYV